MGPDPGEYKKVLARLGRDDVVREKMVSWTA